MTTLEVCESPDKCDGKKSKIKFKKKRKQVTRDFVWSFNGWVW